MTNTDYSQKEEALQNEELQNEVNNEQPITNEAGESDPEALAEATLDAELTAEETLKIELDKVTEDYADMKDKYLRLSAEFDNFRKRTMKEKAELILNGSEKTLIAILPVLDDLERALQTMEKAEDVTAIKEGVDLIYQKFLKILSQNGVSPIETVDKTLDTDFHEAIAMIPAPTEELKGKILDCVKKGYTLNEKVIRHAQVAVGQ
ncbi:MAG: nucleotide exchange factor GrpE [Bacteroidaceae bacterium]